MMRKIEMISPNYERGLILDLCGTLYVSERLSSLYKDKLVEAVESKHSSSRSHAIELIGEETAEYEAKFGYKPATIYLAIKLGVKDEYTTGTNQVDPEPYISYREELEHLTKALSGIFCLCILTHSTRVNTSRILKIMKINKYFDVIVGAEDIQNPKPHIEPFTRVVKLVDIPIESFAMVGDRAEIDLAPAKSLGMKTILIGEGVQSGYVDIIVPTISCLPTALRKIHFL